ncbi:MAG: tetraacyldisaccharide 4'-kinase [Planctomycetes bacterium]|nr:tetraacyldisaccharide 4'-kinase [Planctomycetota bacterium]
MRPEERLAQRGGAVELLRLPALAFSLAARTRGWLYDRRALPITRVSVPVVSIGNITTGGTGKTPLCAAIVRMLASRGFKPGLLSRGYGAAAGELNDEALVLEQLLPGVPHVQDKDRIAGARQLIAQGVTAIVLDDGFQHRRLARDLDLVLVDATRPFGLAGVAGRAPVRALLPRGLLREPPTALRRADGIVITRCEALDARAIEELERELGTIAPGRPIVRARLKACDWRDERNASHALATLAGREVDLVSALGNPAAFEATVRATGVIVRDHRVFRDHHRYSAADLEGLPARGRVLATSQKDAVKLAPLGIAFRALATEIELMSGAHVLDVLLDSLARPREAVPRG